MSMKVLLLIDSLGPGGAQRQLVGLATFLKANGYDTCIAFYHDDFFYENLLEAEGVPYIYLAKASNSRLRIWQIARFIFRVNPDVVISYLETPSICACLAKVFNKRFKLIVSERNTTQKTGIKERIRFYLFGIANYVVPNSFAQESYIKSTFPKLISKIVTIPNFVDLAYFVPSSNRCRRKIPEIMIAASIGGPKNTLGFIDAISILKSKGYVFHVSWYGLNLVWKDYIKECQDKIALFGLERYISLNEKSKNILNLYQSADYFCLPSFYEGTPNVICEAMACGLPVVCSDVCDNNRYVVDGDNGFLFNPHDAPSIAIAIERLFDLSDIDYSNFCRRSREKAENLLSIEAFVDRYIKLLES